MSVKRTPVGEYRALREWIDTTLTELERAETVAGQDDAVVWRRKLMRTAGYLSVLLDAHRPTDRGRCTGCTGRFGLSQPCTVVPGIAAYLLSPLPVAWWQILVRRRQDVTLSQVCTWLGIDDRHRPYKDQGTPDPGDQGRDRPQ